MTLGRATAATAGAAAVALFLAACGGGGATTAAFEPKITTDVPAAKSPVASITWNLPYGEPASLDPALSALESNSTIVSNLCESLQTQTPSGEVKPGLAESIGKTDDRTYVIKLRAGVTFWDGQPMTAEDVAYSINRVLDPATGSSWAMWAGPGATASATGDNEVTVRLKQPSSMTASFFATPAFAVVEKAYAEKGGANFGTAAGGVMCTGPYKLDKWSSGQNVTVLRNDSWWNSAEKPLVQAAKFTFTTDSSAQIAALRGGSVDGSFSVPISGFQSLSTSGNLLFNNSYGTDYLAVTNLQGGLADVKTRAALQAVIDYAGIAKSIYLGAAEPLRALVPPATWGYSQGVFQSAWDKLPAANQDLTKAKQLLSESSYAKTEIVLAYPGSTEEQSKVATVIADSAKSIGLNVQLKPLQQADYAALFGGPQARAGIDAFVSIGYLDFREPAEYYQYWTTGNYYNFANYSNPKYDAAVNAALSEFDDAKRAASVAEAQAILANDLPAIPLLTDRLSVFYSGKLTGLVPSPSYLYAPWLASLGGK